MKLKGKKKDKTKLNISDIQQDGNQSNRKTISPVEIYNKYERKQGQPVLTEEEYIKSIKKCLR